MMKKVKNKEMDSQVFNYVTQKPISKWTRFRLFFCKTYIATDVEGEVSCTTYAKMLNGIIYIVKEVRKIGNVTHIEKL